MGPRNEKIMETHKEKLYIQIKMQFCGRSSDAGECPQECLQKAEIIKKMLESYAWYEDSNAVDLLERFVSLELQYPSLYDINANLAILKHYLMFKNNSKTHVIQKILIQSLMRLPSTDFDLCLCQIPLKIQTLDPMISALIELESLLQTCRFPTFWKTLDSSPYLCVIAKIPDFKNAIRRFMAGVISLAYHTITIEDAGCLLQLDSVNELALFCCEQVKGQWICDKTSGLVTIQKPANSVSLVDGQNSGNDALLSGSTLQKCLNVIKGNCLKSQMV